MKPFFTDAVELNEAFGDELTVAPASKVGEQPGRYGGWCLPHLCRALANGLTIEMPRSRFAKERAVIAYGDADAIAPARDGSTLFSTVKDIGHIMPLVPYARRLRDLGHEVRVATSTDDGRGVLTKAGAHAAFDRPAPDELQAVMKRVDELKGDDAVAFGFREGFAGVAARAGPQTLFRFCCPGLKRT